MWTANNLKLVISYGFSPNMLLLVDVASAGREVGARRARIQRSRAVHTVHGAQSQLSHQQVPATILGS